MPAVGRLTSLSKELNMGLDVYVGTLTRYYAGDWETAAQ